MDTMSLVEYQLSHRKEEYKKKKREVHSVVGTFEFLRLHCRRLRQSEKKQSIKISF